MNRFSDLFDESVGLRRNDSLNPVLWDGDRLRPDVRVKLLNFGEAWRAFAGIPAGAVSDIVMVGGNAGLYYNDESDVDVHLIVDKSALPFGTVTEEYLRDKKALWTARYDVRIRGYQVEPYAQGLGEPFAAGQGVYSLERDAWLQRPTDSRYDPEKDRDLERRVAHWQRAIDSALSGDAGTEAMDVMRDKLSSMRGRSISRHGELGRDNLVFKALRLSGYLSRMSDYSAGKRVGELSLS